MNGLADLPQHHVCHHAMSIACINVRRLGSEFRQEGDVIGEGTYGKVFCAFDLRAKADSGSHGPVVNQLVALKKMKVRETDDYPVPALREVRLLQTLAHPNIVKLLGIAYKSQSVLLHCLRPYVDRWR